MGIATTFVFSKGQDRLTIRYDLNDECWFELSTGNGNSPTLRCNVFGVRQGSFHFQSKEWRLTCSSGTVTDKTLQDIAFANLLAAELEFCGRNNVTSGGMRLRAAGLITMIGGFKAVQD